MTNKQIYELWLQYRQLARSLDFIDPDEPHEARRARMAQLEADPEAWFAYYLPQFATATPAPFHTASTQRILNNPEYYEVRMWSRELAKSTRTMMEALYLLLAGHSLPDGGRLKKRYVLLVSNSLDNATRLLQPYKMQLECNNRIVHDYGDQENPGKWQAAEFTTMQGGAFRALGAGQSPRGTRNEEARPDILIFDDIDTDADCLNPDIIARRWRWIEEAAIGTRSVSTPTTIIFCGNRIAVDCCVHRATAFADHAGIINIRNDDGRSSWPQKNAEEHIERVLSQKSYAAAQKEYFNNPVTEGAVFKDIAWKPATALEDYKALVVYTDPSYKDTADYKATVLVGMHSNEYHIIKCYLEQTTTANMIGWHIALHAFVGQHRCGFYMEEVFLQDMIRKELNDACQAQDVQLHVKGDTRRKPDKFTRIETLLEPLNRNGHLFFNTAEKHNPHMIRLAEQFKALSANSRAHDDGPDAVEGAVWILQHHALRNCNQVTVVGKKLRCTF